MCVFQMIADYVIFRKINWKPQELTRFGQMQKSCWDQLPSLATRATYSSTVSVFGILCSSDVDGLGTC